MEIAELLEYTVKHNASDLHLTSDMPPVVRINGDIVPLRVPSLPASEVDRLIQSVMSEKQRGDYDINMELDFAIQFGGKSRFRVNAYHTVAGPSAAFRMIPSKVLSLEQLSTPEVLKGLCSLSKGMILVTGPTGSGKSTTLAAMIHYINQHYSRHILTIEDPVEFIHRSERSLINQRELGAHTVSFARALKSALREDPDVILVGELRDLETIHLAMTAAETGHLVFATLHTSSAAKTIDRIIDVFPPHDKDVVRTMLASSLEAVIAQKLIKRVDHSGRVAAHEILISTPAVRNLIRDNKVPQINSLLQVGAKQGMVTMQDSVYKLLEQGVISSEEAKHVLNISSESDKEMEIPSSPPPSSAPKTSRSIPNSLNDF